MPGSVRRSASGPNRRNPREHAHGPHEPWRAPRMTGPCCPLPSAFMIQIPPPCPVPLVHAICDASGDHDGSNWLAPVVSCTNAAVPGSYVYTLYDVFPPGGVLANKSLAD